MACPVTAAELHGATKEMRISKRGSGESKNIQIGKHTAPTRAEGNKHTKGGTNDLVLSIEFLELALFCDTRTFMAYLVYDCGTLLPSIFNNKYYLLKTNRHVFVASRLLRTGSHCLSKH